MRGATQDGTEAYVDALISIHAPHAGSDQSQNVIGADHGISIHAPHVGSDFSQ